MGYVLGLTSEQIREGIEKLPFMAGRNNIIQTGRIIILDDCYNANPVSMKAAIDVLDLGIGRKVAILGKMGELGNNEKELHYEVGAGPGDHPGHRGCGLTHRDPLVHHT